MLVVKDFEFNPYRSCLKERVKNCGDSQYCHVSVNSQGIGIPHPYACALLLHYPNCESELFHSESSVSEKASTIFSTDAVMIRRG
jgi:hypothetical protein